MTNFKFYRVGKQWAVKIEACQENGLESPIALFPESVTDDEITQIAVILAKGDTISTSIDFKEG